MLKEVFEQDPVHANEIQLLGLRIDLVGLLVETVEFSETFHVDVVVCLVPDQTLIKIESLNVELLTFLQGFTLQVLLNDQA